VPLHESESRTRVGGSPDEQVSVGGLTGLGDEDVARCDVAGVGVDGAGDDGLEGVGACEDGAARDDPGELCDGEGDHVFSGRRTHPNLGSSSGVEVDGITR
jgi:hypothetical protein